MILAGVPAAGPPAVRADGWQRVAGLESARISTLTPFGTGLLVGTESPAARPRAELALLDPASGRVRPVPVRARSPYAYEGRWRHLAAAGTRVVGVAGISGGAHGNVRWTVWRGGPDGVTEEPQSFVTFGGTDAGALTGAGFAGAGERAVPVVAGSWLSASTGLDAAVWSPRGRTWLRADSTGTDLASSPTELVQVSAVAAGAQPALLLGSVTDLSAGVRVRPALWRFAPTGDGPGDATDGDAGRRPGPGDWRRIDLAEAAPDAAAGDSVGLEAGGCAPEGRPCLLAGRVRGALAAWWVGRARETWVWPITKPEASPEPAPGPIPAPPLPVGAEVTLIAAVADGDSGWLLLDAVGPGQATGRARILQWDGRTWSEFAGPPGVPTSAALVAGRLWVGTADAGVWSRSAP